MCKAKPGPRCSGHTIIKIERIEKSIIDKKKSLKKEVLAHRAADTVEARQEAFTKAKSLKADVDAKEKELAQQKVIYDGTHRGQKELDAKIKEARDSNNPELMVQLANRKSKGRTNHFLSQNRYELKKQMDTGSSIRVRRGNFLTMNDRDNDEVIHDSDLLANS